MTPESGLDIAGPTAESYRTLASLAISFQAQHHLPSRWLNFALAIGIAGIESHPSVPNLLFQMSPRARSGDLYEPRNVWPENRQGHGRNGDSQIIIASYWASPLVESSGPGPHSTLVPPSSTVKPGLMLATALAALQAHLASQQTPSQSANPGRVQPCVSPCCGPIAHPL